MGNSNCYMSHSYIHVHALVIVLPIPTSGAPCNNIYRVQRSSIMTVRDNTISLA